MAKVLILGSGGREHAIGWKLAESEEVDEVLYAPGNVGTAWENKGRNISIDAGRKENFKSIYDLIESEGVDVAVVGPEGLLRDGLVDYLNSKGFENVVGPTMAASMLEADKFYSYDLMEELHIPQARSIKCRDTKEAARAIHELSSDFGVVIKARGLTGGKGVAVCDSLEKAVFEVYNHADRYGEEVLVAEKLSGEEFSVFGLSDGCNVSPFLTSFQDHKALLDGDKGPNTGGMGAYGPAHIAPPQVVKDVVDHIMTPVVRRMAADNIFYKGFIYAGMMMTSEGPKVLEFNARLGDPETQALMMLMESDLYKSLRLSLEGKADRIRFGFKPGASCCVVLASRGYPNKHHEGLEISGLGRVKEMENVKVFHAGTKLKDDWIVTAGGRVLGVSAYSSNGIADAQSLAYEAAGKIRIPGGFHYRTDIGTKAFL